MKQSASNKTTQSKAAATTNSLENASEDAQTLVDNRSEGQTQQLLQAKADQFCEQQFNPLADQEIKPTPEPLQWGMNKQKGFTQTTQLKTVLGGSDITGSSGVIQRNDGDPLTADAINLKAEAELDSLDFSKISEIDKEVPKINIEILQKLKQNNLGKIWKYLSVDQLKAVTETQAKGVEAKQVDLLGEKEYLAFEKIGSMELEEFKKIKFSYPLSIDQHISLSKDHKTAYEGSNKDKDGFKEVMNLSIPARIKNLTDFNVGERILLLGSHIDLIPPTYMTVMDLSTLGFLSDKQKEKLTPQQIIALGAKIMCVIEVIEQRLNVIPYLTSSQLELLLEQRPNFFNSERNIFINYEALKNEVFGKLPETSVKNFTPDQIKGLSASQINKLATTSIKEIKFVDFIKPSEFQSLNDSFFSTLTEDQIKKITPAQIKVLSSSKILKLGDKIASLTGPTVQAIASGHFKDLSGELDKLTPEQFKYVTPSQLDKLDTNGVKITLDQFKLLVANKLNSTVKVFADINKEHFTHLSNFQAFSIDEKLAEKLTFDQLEKIPETAFKYISPVAFAKIRDSVIQQMKAADLQKITVEQAYAMTIDQLKKINQRLLKDNNQPILEAVLARLPQGASGTNALPTIRAAGGASRLVEQIPGTHVRKNDYINTPDVIAESKDKRPFSATNIKAYKTVDEIKGVPPFYIPEINNSVLSDKDILRSLTTDQIPHLTLLQIHEIKDNIDLLTENTLVRKQIQVLGLSQIQKLKSKNKLSRRYCNHLTEFQVWEVTKAKSDDFKDIRNDISPEAYNYVWRLVHKEKPQLLEEFEKLSKIDKVQVPDAVDNDYSKSKETLRALGAIKGIDLNSDAVYRNDIIGLGKYKRIRFFTDDNEPRLKEGLERLKKHYVEELNTIIDADGKIKDLASVKKSDILSIPSDLIANYGANLFGSMAEKVSFFDPNQISSLSGKALDHENIKYLHPAHIQAIKPENFPIGSTSVGQKALAENKLVQYVTILQLQAIEKEELHSDFLKQLNHNQLNGLTMDSVAFKQMAKSSLAKYLNQENLKLNTSGDKLESSEIGIKHLTASQITGLSNGTTSDLKFPEKNFDKSLLNQLSAEQIKAIPVEKISSIIDALKDANKKVISYLSTAQVKQLTADDLNALDKSGIRELSQGQLAVIDSATLSSYLKKNKSNVELFNKDQIEWVLPKIDFDTVNKIKDLYGDSHKYAPTSNMLELLAQIPESIVDDTGTPAVEEKRTDTAVTITDPHLLPELNTAFPKHAVEHNNDIDLLLSLPPKKVAELVWEAITKSRTRALNNDFKKRTRLPSTGIGNDYQFSNHPQELKEKDTNYIYKSNFGQTAYDASKPMDANNTTWFWCEHDIYPKQTSLSRGAYRIVFTAKQNGTAPDNGTSTVYFTPDHYNSFIRLN